MRCELDSVGPGPCVLQSPAVNGSKDLGFCCIEMEASSYNVVFQLTVTAGDMVLNTRKILYVDNTFNGMACVTVPTASNTLYLMHLNAFSYLESSLLNEWAEISSFYLSSEDLARNGQVNSCSAFSYLWYFKLSPMLPMMRNHRNQFFQFLQWIFQISTKHWETLVYEK
jgi:hypothetical protein